MKIETLQTIQSAIKLLNDHANADFVSMKEARSIAESLKEIITSEKSELSDINDIFRDIIIEVNRAETKHPNWPSDQVYAAAIVGEESGELMRAAVQYQMEGGEKNEIKLEAIQTAATCIRLLKNFY